MSTMTKRIFRATLLVGVAVLIASLTLVMGALYSYFGRVQESQLRDELSLAAVGVEQNGMDYLRKLESDQYRITWLDADGTVLYDTRADAESMENHAQRQEVQQALATGEGESSRYSDTLLQKTVYYAKRLPDGTVLRVLDVHEQAGVIWHTVDALPAAAAPGAAVAGCIDWDWRFDKMQQHTGEHILSGILHQMFGAENVGFHVGTEAVRMDTSVPISPEGLRQAELAANRIVWQDVPVLISYPTREELAALVYRSKKEIEGQVRIVTIPGADVCACCGTHTRTTGQVGQIKILASENYKGGVRLSVVCGARALAAAQAMRARQAEIGALLSAKADQTAVAVHRVYDEYTALKFTHFGLCSQLFDALAQLTAPDADAIRTLPGLDPDGLHRLAVRLTEATTGLCAALTPTEKGTGYCLARRDGDVRALTKALNAALNGRGGGKPGICQGSCAATPEQVEAFLREQK